jgi:hypothetical protein
MDEPRSMSPPPAYIVPHADHGNPECCGLIEPRIGEQAELNLQRDLPELRHAERAHDSRR